MLYTHTCTHTHEGVYTHHIYTPHTQMITRPQKYKTPGIDCTQHIRQNERTILGCALSAHGPVVSCLNVEFTRAHAGAHAYIHACNVYTPTHACACNTCTCACTRTHPYARAHTYAHTHTYAYMYTYTHSFTK